MRMESPAAPMADALAAYRLVATDATARPDVVPRNDDEVNAIKDIFEDLRGDNICYC